MDDGGTINLESLVETHCRSSPSLDCWIEKILNNQIVSAIGGGVGDRQRARRGSGLGHEAKIELARNA